MEKVSCLGPAGSYSELAAQRFFLGAAEIVLCRNFKEVIGALQSGETDYAVVPIENSIQGGVLQNLDLMERSDVFAEAELVLPIDHRLARKAGAAQAQIRRIYSHEQAIGQCAEYLTEHFPDAQRVYTASTAESLSRLDGESAGIVGAHVRAEGVVLSAENIADEKQNFTRFLRLARRGEQARRHSEMIFLCAVLKHAPGTLEHLLRIFADYGKNLTRIESRPIRGVFGEYRFFIELEGDIADPAVKEMLLKSEEYCTQFRILGAYGQKSASENR